MGESGTRRETFKPLTFTAKTVVKAPPETVFDFIADAGNDGEWSDMVGESETVGGEPKGEVPRVFQLLAPIVAPRIGLPGQFRKLRRRLED